MMSQCTKVADGTMADGKMAIHTMARWPQTLTVPILLRRRTERLDVRWHHAGWHNAQWHDVDGMSVWPGEACAFGSAYRLSWSLGVIGSEVS